MSQSCAFEHLRRFRSPHRAGWYHELSDSGVVLHLAGELDVATGSDLEGWLHDAVESEDTASILVDLSNVDFIDAFSIGLIMRARAVAVRRGRLLQVNGLAGLPARVFELLGLDGVVRPSAPSLHKR